VEGVVPQLISCSFNCVIEDTGNRRLKVKCRIKAAQAIYTTLCGYHIVLSYCLYLMFPGAARRGGTNRNRKKKKKKKKKENCLEGRSTDQQKWNKEQLCLKRPDINSDWNSIARRRWSEDLVIFCLPCWPSS
jgi:hypothetical protein